MTDAEKIQQEDARAAVFEQRLEEFKERHKVTHQSWNTTWIIDTIMAMFAVEAFKDDRDNNLQELAIQTLLALHVTYRFCTKYRPSDSLQKLKLYKRGSPEIIERGYAAYLDSLDAVFKALEEETESKESKAELFSATRTLSLAIGTVAGLEIQHPVVYVTNAVLAGNEAYRLISQFSRLR